MAKKKTAPKKKPRVLKPKVISIGPATSKKKKKPAKKTTKKKERKKMVDITLMPAAEKPSVLIPQNNRRSLTAWLSLYMKIDGEACAEQTRIAKMQDMERFLDYFSEVTDNADQKSLWTRSISVGFQKELQKTKSARTGRKLAPTTINRVMATLRTAAKWIHAAEAFVAGNPMDRIGDLTLPEPTWQGLTDLEMVRMKAAADQLLATSTAENQWPKRDFATFHLLYATAMRVTELISLDFEQYDGKYLLNVNRKGNTVTTKIFLVKHVRDALNDYIEDERGDAPGPLIQTRTENSLSIQQVDYLLKRLAGQANASLTKRQDHIKVHPHVLRHTMLRKVLEEKGIEYAIEFAGHVSEKYIRRYTLPSREKQEAVLEELFG